MPASRFGTLLTALSVALVLVGVGVAAGTLHELASMPPPPPGSDGFAHGMAGFVGGLVVLVSLAVVAVGLSLPGVVGVDSPLGYGRYQQLALRGAWTVAGGGVVLGAAVALVAGLQFGLLVVLVLVALATAVVFATAGWRLVEALVRVVVRGVGDTP